MRSHLLTVGLLCSWSLTQPLPVPVSGSFVRVALWLYSAFGWTVLFTMLILPIHKRGLSFPCPSVFPPSFRSPVVHCRPLFRWPALPQVLHLLCSYCGCNCFNDLRQSLVFEKATDFCMLILCPATLMSVFMSS